MATEITKILPEEYIHKGVIGLPDSPELSTLEMQERFDEIAIDVIIPHINGMVTEINEAVDGAIEAAHEEVLAEKDRAEDAELELSDAIDAISTQIDTLGLSVVDGKLCMTYNT